MSLTIEGYRVEALSQEDAMLQRYAAEAEPRSGRARALRLTVVTLGRDDVAPPYFTEDADAARALGERGSATVIDAGVSEDGHLYVVQAATDAPTLAALLEERGPLPPSLVARIGADVARELAAAHAMDPPLGHLALRPASIRVDRDGFAHADDFAIGRVGVALGSVKTTVLAAMCSYMAPEQVDPRGEPDARADLFGLASVLYEALTGRRPFEGSSPVATTIKVSMAKPPPLDAVPAELAAVLERMWAREPSERGEARTVAQALAELAGREADARRELSERAGAGLDVSSAAPLRFDAFAEMEHETTDLQTELPNYVPTDVSLPMPEGSGGGLDDLEHEATALDVSTPSAMDDGAVAATLEIPNPASEADGWTDRTVPLQQAAVPGAEAPIASASPGPTPSPIRPQSLDPKPAPLDPPGAAPTGDSRRTTGGRDEISPALLWTAVGVGAVLVIGLATLAGIWIAT